MSFYFRKFQTLQLIPTAKRSLGFGFSTRVNRNESEKDKVVTADIVGSNSDRSAAQTPFCTENEGVVYGEKFKMEWNHLPELSKETVVDLVPSVPTTSAIVPVTLTHLQNLLHEGALVLQRHSSTPDLTSGHKDILNVFSESVKPIHFTSDDIIVSDIEHRKSECGRIPVDILIDQAFVPDFGKASNHFSSQLPNTTASQRLEFGSDSSIHSASILQTEKSTDCSDTSTFHTIYSSSNGGGSEGDSNLANKNAESSKNGPSPDQLYDMKDKLENLVTTMFTAKHDYSLLHKNVTLENNLFGDNQVAVGVTAYSLGLLKLRLRVHARYSKIEMEILSTTTLEQTGVIRLHWRLKGVNQARLLKFWKVFSVDSDDVEWMEAFSYFHIGKDGLVHKHRIDRMLHDDERDTIKLTKKLQNLLNPAKPLVS